MRMHPAPSSSIKAAGYDARQRTLRLRYAGGGTYEYFGVPASVVKDFIAAPSKGRFVNLRIKPCYRYRRVNAPGRQITRR